MKPLMLVPVLGTELSARTGDPGESAGCGGNRLDAARPSALNELGTPGSGVEGHSLNPGGGEKLEAVHPQAGCARMSAMGAASR